LYRTRSSTCYRYTLFYLLDCCVRYYRTSSSTWYRYTLFYLL